jgi:hypothetical protein
VNKQLRLYAAEARTVLPVYYKFWLPVQVKTKAKKGSCRVLIVWQVKGFV